jgi:hypothetical protein
MSDLNDIVTHAGPERRYRMCRCSVCGIVERCTPRRDFYGTNGKPLVCEDCFAAELRCQGIVAVIDCTKPRGNA